jgi:hypothetical protein
MVGQDATHAISVLTVRHPDEHFGGSSLQTARRIERTVPAGRRVDSQYLGIGHPNEPVKRLDRRFVAKFADKGE